ncbi:Calumenin [Dissostichus eleginoides]|uniref:Reticulocalbin-3 n=1 Tax=Dissostichus eleginoides TaxID=100907 RepID=A0AAD9B600_DISEL|nr:Calumenin [Dissostichus eleginoides]
MKLLRSLASICLLAAAALSVPTQEKRVHHQADLSDRAHDDSHGFQYDHEAFLGKEEAKTFDQLTPEESKDKLAMIVGRIDTDKDGYISHAELHHWIKHRQRRYIEENVNKHWKDYDKNQDGKIGWQEYKNTTYGFYLDEEFDDVEDKATYKSMLTRDERRFKTADRDGDGIATREEFTAFLHPEEFDYMKDLVVQDGYLDNAEVAHWVLPGEVDHADNEAKHLIHETDTDKDQKITKKEILANWNMFVGSQVTNYGEDLTKRHDEL